MIGRAAVVPLSEPLQARLGPPLARALRPRWIICAGGSAHSSPGASRRRLTLSMRPSTAMVPRSPRSPRGLTRDLPGDAVERLFALGFALDQLHRILKISNSVSWNMCDQQGHRPEEQKLA